MPADTGLRLVVGLGNPGPRYQDNRHNVGFWWVDRLAERFDGRFRGENRFLGELCALDARAGEVRLLKPTTYMNRSGAAVAACARYFKVSPAAVLVVHDELDLPSGVVRLKQGGGHGGHNGLRDIVSALGSADFWRLRIGIDHPGHKDQVTDYVLHRPSQAQQQAIEAAMDLALDRFEDLSRGRFAQAMNSLHARSAAG